MAKTQPKVTQKPAATPEQIENECIDLAYREARKRLSDGTATSQLITEFIRAGSFKRELELEELKNKNELLMAKVKTLESQRSSEEIASKALEAMKIYSGHGDDNEY